MFNNFASLTFLSHNDHEWGKKISVNTISPCKVSKGTIETAFIDSESKHHTNIVTHIPKALHTIPRHITQTQIQDKVNARMCMCVTDLIFDQGSHHVSGYRTIDEGSEHMGGGASIQVFSGLCKYELVSNFTGFIRKLCMTTHSCPSEWLPSFCAEFWIRPCYGPSGDQVM